MHDACDGQDKKIITIKLKVEVWVKYAIYNAWTNRRKKKMVRRIKEEKGNAN